MRWRPKTKGFETMESEQPTKPAKHFRLGPLSNLSQVTRALGKTIRAMANGTLDSQTGARIANALGIQRQCLETGTLQKMEERLDELELDHAERHGHSTETREGLRAH